VTHQNEPQTKHTSAEEMEKPNLSIVQLLHKPILGDLVFGDLAQQMPALVLCEHASDLLVQGRIEMNFRTPKPLEHFVRFRPQFRVYESLDGWMNADRLMSDTPIDNIRTSDAVVVRPYLEHRAVHNFEHVARRFVEPIRQFERLLDVSALCQRDSAPTGKVVVPHLLDGQAASVEHLHVMFVEMHAFRCLKLASDRSVEHQQIPRIDVFRLVHQQHRARRRRARFNSSAFHVLKQFDGFSDLPSLYTADEVQQNCELILFSTSPHSTGDSHAETLGVRVGSTIRLVLAVRLP
jgi:hypothetical protein